MREFAIGTKEFIGEKGQLTGVKTVRLEWKDGKMTEVPGSEQIIKADLVFLAMGFVSPVQAVLDAFGVEKDQRGNAKASTDLVGGYATSVPKLFAAGTCAVDSLWLCGPSVKAARPRVRWTSS